MRRRLIAICAAGALLLGACGTRTDGSEDASGDLGGGDGGGSGQTAPVGGGGLEEGRFGDLEIPCGPGDTSSYPEQSDQGVTRDAIVVTTIADPGGPRPGLNQGMFDSAQAFVDWCNGLGGINGRTIDLRIRDAKILEYKERVLEACEDSFALVGGLGVFDEVGAQDQVDCGLVNVPGAAVSGQQAEADLTWQPLPNPQDQFPTGGAEWVAGEYPEAITRAANIRSKVPVTEVQAQRQAAAYEQVGYDFVYIESSNINESNWDPMIIAMRNADIGYFTLTSTYEEYILMLAAQDRQGWHPEVVELETNFYNAGFPEALAEQGLEANDVFVRLTTWPFEEADDNPAMASYLELLEASSSPHDTEPEQLGVQTFSAFLLWATAVDALGADVTREALADQLDTMTSWTGGGLHGEANPAENEGTTCFVMMQVTSEGFIRRYPLPDEDAEVFEAGKGYACPEDGRRSIEGFGGKGARAD